MLHATCPIVQVDPEEQEDLLEGGDVDTSTSRPVPPTQETEAKLLDIGGISREGLDVSGTFLHL